MSTRATRFQRLERLPPNHFPRRKTKPMQEATTEAEAKETAELGRARADRADAHVGADQPQRSALEFRLRQLFDFVVVVVVGSGSGPGAAAADRRRRGP